MAGGFHAERIYEFFDGRVNDTGFKPKTRPFALFLLFTNRSGSNYVAELLASTGEINMAEESLIWPVAVRLAAKKDIWSLDELLDELKTRAVHGRFAVKIEAEQFIWMKEAGIIDRHFSDVALVKCERKDQLAQAVSFYMADQTRQWASYLEPLVDEKDVPFDKSAIDDRLAWIRQQNETIETGLSHSPLHCRVVYEEVLENPQLALTPVLNMLGIIEAQIKTDGGVYKRQSSPEKEALTRLYRSAHLDVEMASEENQRDEQAPSSAPDAPPG